MKSSPCNKTTASGLAMISLAPTACGCGGEVADPGTARDLVASVPGTGKHVSVAGSANAEAVVIEATAEANDPAARTQAALYLSARGANELERRMNGDVV
jgi:hypothetical protein